ncbi:DDE-type integrase/transposase/recombinase [Halorubrum sp. GN11GM_10-3_MGM]|uniref:DDE-type integrase/transposase/recombinase n=1 Tax=Halorubrum sp. GN11GM_10-3_MGM TaxID=2518111 RepID=UPI0013051CC1|nr:DDE-type integrase/transposase/recombinase [Halorubrum sp. GN11GM_10-3_MGM]
MVEKARQQKVFSREDTPTERRVLAAFLYHAGLSCCRIEPFVDRSYEAIRQRFHRLKDFFEPDYRDRQEIAVDKAKTSIDGDEHYVWAAVDCETLGVLAVEVSTGRSSLDAFCFLKDVLERCRGRPLVRADRGPWYDWPLERLDCEYERETWGNRSLIEAWFEIFKYRTRCFYHRFPFHSTASSTRSWLTAFAALTMPRSNLDTLHTAKTYSFD